MAAGHFHTCAIASATLPQQGKDEKKLPGTPIPLHPDPLIAIFNGGNSPQKIARSQMYVNSLQCWGHNDFGETFVHPFFAEDTSQVAAGWAHTCALRQGQVLCWGFNK